MTEEEARVVIRSEPYTNVRKHLEAIRVAEEVLGEDATLEQIWRWAEKGVVEDEIHSSFCGGDNRDPVS